MTLKAKASRLWASVKGQAAWLGLDGRPGELFLVTGGGDWAVKEIAAGLTPHLVPAFASVTTIDQLARRPFLTDAAVHCLCRPAYFKGAGVPPLHRSNRLVVSWLHGGRQSDSPEIVAACGQLERHWRRARRFVVPNTQTLRDVLDCGVDPAIVSVIPNGVNLSLFQPCADAEARRVVRRGLGLPDDAVVVGSFQRDEDDAGAPKWVKGPDTLVDAMIEARRQVPVHALLTGPGRRYVRRGLESGRVPFTHVEQAGLDAMARMYHALDIYCVSSREEGGPAPLRESMASGVPVVSTRVGLAIDLLVDGENGVVVDIEDASGLAQGIVAIAADPAWGARLSGAASLTVRQLDFSAVAARLRHEVYREAFS